MIGMKKGLFGKRGGMPGVISGYGGGTFDMDGTQVTPASMPQNQTMQDGANLGTPAAQKGGGFFGQGGGGRAIAGTLGDFLLQQGGMAPVYAPQQQFQQVQAMRQAEAQRARAAELADYETKKGIDQRYATPEAPKPGSFEWFQTATPEQRATYDQYNPVIATTWQGPTPIPRSRLGVPQGPQPGTVEDGFRFKGGDPSNPSSWEPVGGSQPQTPAAPIRGARTITQQEYGRILRSMGGDQRRMNAWMSEQNVMAGN